MSTKRKLNDLTAQGVVIGDGAIGSMLYERGIFVNRCFEELNTTNPDIIKQLHKDYIDAGADFIETNTYGANRIKLAAYGLADKVRQFNTDGTQAAIEAAQGKVLVAGSVGPVIAGFEKIGEDNSQLFDTFSEQIEALANAGADFLILETFSSIEEILTAIKAAQSVCSLEIIASLRPKPEKTQTDTDILVENFTRLCECENLYAAGLNCGAGPAVMLQYLEAVRPLTEKPICIQPNVGLPQSVDGRTLYMCTPEYVSEYAKRFYEKGADIIGGCCGTGPEHIREIVRAVKSVSRADRTVERIEISPNQPQSKLPSATVELSKRSKLGYKLASSEPISMIEISPPRSISLDDIIEKVQLCAKHGIDAVNIPDGPRACCRQSAMATAIKLQQCTDIETVLHICARDRNIIALQSDILGAQSLGLANMLLITGDPPKLGDYPDATGVFDVDAIGLTRMASLLNCGLDVSGRQIPQAAAVTIGVGANPGANDIDREIERFRLKVQAGAEYCITQPVFDTDAFLRFADAVADCKIPIIAGIWPFVSYKNAEFMANEVPGIVVPPCLLERMAKTANRQQAISEGIKIAKESIEKISDITAGFAVSAPFGNVKIALSVLGKISLE